MGIESSWINLNLIFRFFDAMDGVRNDFMKSGELVTYGLKSRNDSFLGIFHFCNNFGFRILNMVIK